MARPITKQFQSSDGSLSVMTLDRQVEELIQGSIQRTEVASFLALEPTVAEKLLVELQGAVEEMTPQMETSPVLLASPGIRHHLRKFVERFMPDLAVLSHSEIIPSVQIKTLKVVNLNAN